MKKIYLLIGSVSAVLGILGSIFPFLPTFPFVLFSGFCFSKSSDVLYKHLTSSKFYRNNFESYANGRGMTVGTKTRIILSVSAVIAVGYFLTDSTAVKIILSVVWLSHVIYFIFFVESPKG